MTQYITLAAFAGVLSALPGPGMPYTPWRKAAIGLCTVVLVTSLVTC